MKLPNVNNYSFANNPRTELPRSAFNRSCTHKTTFDSDYLIPLYVDEVYPATTLSIKATSFARLATPLVPIQDNLEFDQLWFAVPFRILYDNWVKLCGQRNSPDDSIDFSMPTVLAPATTGWTYGSIADYFGVPTGVPLLRSNSIFFRAYNLIFNEWMRSQDLQDPVPFDPAATSDNAASFVLKKSCKKHDYFTSLLPWPQKSDQGVMLPFTGTAPVMGLATDSNSAIYNVDLAATFKQQGGEAVGTNWAHMGANILAVQGDATSKEPRVYADLESVSAVSVNDMRMAFQVQKILEKDARGGTRYNELCKNHFGCDNPDSRVQRPEFLNGTSTPVQITPIPQTSATISGQSPQGNLAATGQVVAQSGFSKSFTEHMVIMCIGRIRGQISYQQGHPKIFQRKTRYDYYWPSLCNLGEMAVSQGEIFCDGSANDDIVLGYQERWSDRRYGHSKITGKFRSTDPQSLDVWHLAEEFENAPTLNETFIESNTPLARCIAVTDEPHWLCDSFFEVTEVLPLPARSIPGLIDHF